MFRLVVKGSIFDVVEAIRAHTIGSFVVRLVQHATFADEWLVDLAARPGDHAMRFTLNAWYCETLPATPPYPNGSLLFWTEVEDTLISVQAQANTMTDEAMSRGMWMA